MGKAAYVEMLTALAERVGFDVRFVAIEGPGGVCRVHGRPTILLGDAAPDAQQIDVLCEALSDVDLENVYLLPAARRLIEDYRRRGPERRAD